MMDKKIMLVDDVRSAPGVTIARTSSDALQLLHGSWDELWLDHDLGGSDTVWPIIRELERRHNDGIDIGVTSIIVHTANPIESIRMIVALHKLPVRLRRTTATQMVQELSRAS